jgi:toxin ParE1/3/4
MRIVWRARARADLLGLVSYIAKDSPSAAFRVHDQILHMVGFLADWPGLGRAGRRSGLHELVVPRTPYLVLYRRERENQVIILRVIHGRQKR